MVKRKKYQVLAIVLGLVILMGLPILDICEAEEKGPVKIGLATWTEGPALRGGRSYTRAFKTAISYINDRGGILGGRKVVGVITSQGMSGETAKAAALKLVLKDKVKALIGPQWAMTAAAGSISEKSIGENSAAAVAAILGGTHIRYEVRDDRIGYIQRGTPPVAADIALGTEFGAKAVEAMGRIVAGGKKSGASSARMVAKEGGAVTDKPLAPPHEIRRTDIDIERLKLARELS